MVFLSIRHHIYIDLIHGKISLSGPIGQDLIDVHDDPFEAFVAGPHDHLALHYLLQLFLVEVAVQGYFLVAAGLLGVVDLEVDVGLVLYCELVYL